MPAEKGPQLDTLAPEESRFHQIVNTAITKEMDEIAAKYETPVNPNDRLYYHVRWHSQSGVNRIGRIMDAMGAADSSITQRDKDLARFIMAHHDDTQESIEDVKPTGEIVRKRRTGYNEEKSAERAIARMIEINAREGMQIFTPEDSVVAHEAIMLTVPSGWDGKTVFQPDFGKSSLIAKAVALADLGGSGMDGKDMAQTEALTLYLEDNLDYTKYMGRLHEDLIRRVSSQRNRDFEQQCYTRLLTWLQRQKVFIGGRQERIGGEIGTLPTEVMRQAVGALFTENNFSDSLQRLDDLHDSFTKMPDFDDWSNQVSLLAVPAS